MTPFDPLLALIAAEARVKPCHVFHCFHARRELGQKFHPAAFAQFAGLEERHVLSILAALEAHDALPGKRTVSAKGTRLPADWTAPQEWIDWACNERRWQPHDAAEEARIFADYWIAKAGQAAVKLDWKRTWQVWVRNSRRPNGDYSPVTSQSPADRVVWLRKMIDLYGRLGRELETRDWQAELERLENNVVPIRHAV